jgi:ADP-L-glycero-D-manno-heptose 6-epimerase
MIYHLGNQIRETGTARLFTGGEQLRDFIYVKDVVKACLCAWNAPSGIYNVGTGVGTSFNGLVSVLSSVLKKPAQINYFDMPYVSDSYQHHTQAETTLAKKRLGFISEWPLEKAVRDYYKWLGWVE